MTLLGREREQADLAALLTDAQEGRSRVLVVRGEAGIGTTALLDDLERSADDFLVLRVTGVESEQELTYAALHRLLAPVLDRHSALPDPQRRALGAAFGLVDALPVDRFLLSLAMLSLIAGVAEERPVLCIVDDAHLVDDGSLAVLAFVARRLDADCAGVIFGARPDLSIGALAGLPALCLGGLSAEAAADLLRAIDGGPVHGEVARRLTAETGGSPLALAEIGALLTEGQLAGREELPEPLPIGKRLEAHYLELIRALPEPARLLLLVAAAGAPADHRLISAAATSLGVWPNAVDTLETTGLLTFGPMPRFRHPLVRSVIYAGSPAPDRRRAHHALAMAADDAGEPVRAAWHLGLAAAGPDEAVAARLAAVAEDALQRGGCGMAAAFRSRAASLTPGRALRVERALEAAYNLLASGSPVRARDVLADLAPDLNDDIERGRVRRLDGQLRYALGETTGTPSLLAAAAQDLRESDVHLARDTLLDGLWASRLTGRYTADGESELDLARAARAMPLPDHATPAIADRLLDALSTLHLDGAGAAHPLLLDALAAIEASGDGLDRHGRPTEKVRWLGIGCWAAGAAVDDARLLALALRLEATARPHGALGAVSIALLNLAMARLAQGALPAARSHLDERAALLGAMGWPTDVGELLGLAWAGEDVAARAEALRVAARAAEHRHGWMLVFSDYALSVLDLGLGNYSAALDPAHRTYTENPFFVLPGYLNVVEAAVRGGAPELAVAAGQDLRARAGADPTPLTRALLATGEALLAGPATAEAHFEDALRQLPWADGTVRGRVALLYGEWLRRQKRKLDAREQLGVAHRTLAGAGAAAFADRARRELAAAGHRIGRDTPGESVLTTQEARITELAASGATNAEIAAQLFLSVSTVDYHLRKVFRKLGVSSRRQLAAAAGLRDVVDSPSQR